MVIYTKRGDKGETSLFDKDASQRTRVSKGDLKVQVLGAIDELNSFLGIVISHAEDNTLRVRLNEVQKDLLTIGSITAGSDLKFPKTKTYRLEKVVDELEGKLPVLKNFVLPGGTKIASFLQYSRVLARRAERMMVALSADKTVKPQILTYLNRLSDYLFMLAREANFKANIKDEVWIGKKR